MCVCVFTLPFAQAECDARSIYVGFFQVSIQNDPSPLPYKS